MPSGETIIMPTATDPHVYVSSHEADRAAADNLSDTLRGAGIPIWRPEELMKQSKLERLEATRQAIMTGRLVILACSSAKSNDLRGPSDHYGELLYAIEYSRTSGSQQEAPQLIPVKFDECQTLPYGLGGGRDIGSLVRADLFGPDKQENMSWLSSGLSTILQRMRGEPDSRSAEASDAFVSYSPTDKPSAKEISQDLEVAGISTWLSSRDLLPGQDRQLALRTAIGKAASFVAIYSSAGLTDDSNPQNTELALATEEVRLRSLTPPWFIPVRLDNCILPDWQIGLKTLSKLPSVDFSQGDWDSAMSELVDMVDSRRDN